MSRDFAESTGDDLGVNTALLELGQKEIEFTVTDERIAADDGDVQRLVFVYQGKNTCDEIISTEVGEIAELCLAAEMRAIERVAAGTSQGTFLCDLDGERRRATGQDSSPSMENFRFLHCLSATAKSDLK